MTCSKCSTCSACSTCSTCSTCSLLMRLKKLYNVRTKGSHNTCLCEAKLEQTSGENSTGLAENSVNTQLVGTECRITLQTAQAIISGESQGRIRVLFDSGSHRSFVTVRAASKFDLPVVRKEWVTNDKHVRSEWQRVWSGRSHTF